TSKTTSTDISVSETIHQSNSKSSAQNESCETSTSSNDNVTRNESLEVEAKEATEWVKYIDEVLLPRLDYGRGKGLFLTCACLFSDVPAVLRRLAHTAISLYSGPKGNRSALSFYQMGRGDEACQKMLQNMQLPVKDVKANTVSHEVLAVLAQDIPHSCVFGGNWLSAQELSIFAALPQKEVSGLALREEVDFGLNPKTSGDDIPESERLEIGQLVQNGLKTKLPVFFDKRELNKHLFITGVTGSGKTTTCQHILTEWGWGKNPRPFLVIEPAKTEYRILKDRDVIFFTPGQQDVAPFYLNPFELFPGEKITARADMLKATFTASFEMEAAIPQIFETAIYRVYGEKGWDIHTNLWNRKKEDAEDGPFADGVYAFPTLSDFLKATEEVTNDSGFGDRLKNEYNGSIKARLTSLLVGAKGMMLDTPRSIDFRDLIKRHVVIELEEIKSGEEKALLMGFILINLMQAIKSEHQKNSHFRHITLVEEAHRLLSRYEPGDSMNKKQGVGVFADMLAEVRKYGESLMIADQIPEKMVPDVLKNTNTKIVHKIFAKDDKEAIGDTMALDDDQKSFLSKLPAGRAIMLTQGWNRAVQVQVKNTTDTSQAEIQPEELREIAIRYYAEESVWKRGVLFGSGRTNVAPTPEIAKEYLWLTINGGELIKQYKNFMQAGDSTEENIKSLKEEIELVSQNARDELWQTYLVSYAYQEKSYDRDRDERAIEFLKKVRTGQWTHEEYHDTKFRTLKN
ncbi:MAG: ATP-binding protein, partial [Acetobacter sp.]|nr:ATP-binding protein [Acetobacter sp.]